MSLDDLLKNLPDGADETRLGDTLEGRDYLQNQSEHLAQQIGTKGAKSFMTAVSDHISTNGAHRPGRAVPLLPEHTFKDSGITIKIRKVGPTTQQRLAQQILKDFPEPQPPIVETEELGPEANSADPAYIAARAAWESETRNEHTQRLMLIAALEAEATIDDAARADIARKKRHLGLIGIPYEDNPNLTTEENEKVFYILHVAAATPDDLGEFSAAVLRRSVPTEEAVQAQVATFRGDVQGA